MTVYGKIAFLFTPLYSFHAIPFKISTFCQDMRQNLGEIWGLMNSRVRGYGGRSGGLAARGQLRWEPPTPLNAPLPPLLISLAQLLFCRRRDQGPASKKRACVTKSVLRVQTDTRERNYLP